MSAKSTIIPLPALGGQNVKSVNRYKYWGLCSTLSSLIDIQRQLQYQYCAPNKLRASFSCCSNAVKMHFFVPSVCPYMHHKYGVISGRQACRDCVWLIILGAGLYATCRGERVLVITRFNANSYLWDLIEQKCVPLSWTKQKVQQRGCALRCSQVVYIRPYSLNTTTAFYFATEYSDVAVFVWRGVHAEYFTWPSPGLDSVSYSGSSV